MNNSIQKRLILIGAGAEFDFKLPTGGGFTLETFYSKKSDLYDALRGFYSRNPGILPKYSKHFLFDKSSTIFLQLCENLISRGGNELQAYLPYLNVSQLAEQMRNDHTLDSLLKPKQREMLYEELICDTGANPTANKNAEGIRSLLDGEDAFGTSHYGILETYYSSLIDRESHPVHLWKLINFYWSAFFCIALPFAETIYAGVESYSKDPYGFVLDNLVEFCCQLDSCASRMFEEHPNCYYAKLHGKFDYVATTNYTPFADKIKLRNASKRNAIKLSGSLTRFERLDTLTTFDLAERGSMPTDTIVFPFLMCQSPVKPIIELHQIEEYGKMAQALRAVDEIAVLGYSFCPEDTHIATMVSQSLHENPGQHCTFFQYVNENTEEAKRRYTDAAASSLRLLDPLDRKRLSVKFIYENDNGDDRSEFDAYLSALN